MRDLISCFSEHGVKVSDSSCKSSVIIDSRRSSVSSASSVQKTVVASLYRSQLSSEKEVLIKVSWSKTHVGPALSMGVDETPYAHGWSAESVDSVVLRKRRGSQSYASGACIIDLHWDFSAAKFDAASPEPLSNFYAAVLVDGDFALLLGDIITQYPHRVNIAGVSLVGRREQVLSQAVYSTKARFCDDGKEHDIVIACNCNCGRGEAGGDPELVVSVDKKRVVHAKNLRWNFRGNQTVFIDGSPVDMLWDVKDWLFSTPEGYAAFMFRKRSALESRLWFEEEVLHRERGIAGFSLLIQSFKNPSSSLQKS